jgi:hypothetical protein
VLITFELPLLRRHGLPCLDGGAKNRKSPDASSSAGRELPDLRKVAAFALHTSNRRQGAEVAPIDGLFEATDVGTDLWNVARRHYNL